MVAETAAALAAASIVFSSVNATYSAQLLTAAKALYTFANQYRGTYQSSISNAGSFYSWALKLFNCRFAEFVFNNFFFLNAAPVDMAMNWPGLPSGCTELQTQRRISLMLRITTAPSDCLTHPGPFLGTIKPPACRFVHKLYDMS